jgi:hypothetical protein
VPVENLYLTVVLAALPPDVRLWLRPTVEDFSIYFEATPLAAEVAAKILEASLSERQSLSAHQAAKPQISTSTSRNICF